MRICIALASPYTQVTRINSSRMKSILYLFFLTAYLTCPAQNNNTIALSQSTLDGRKGLWAIGDYLIQIDLQKINTLLYTTTKDYANAILRCKEADSNLVNYYKPTVKRYQKATNLLINSNRDVDLRTLIIYNGIDDAKQDVGNSAWLAYQIEHLVKTGQAIVYYKGKRIYSLNIQSELKEEGDILNRHYIHRIYVDDIENCIFNNYVNMGW